VGMPEKERADVGIGDSVGGSCVVLGRDKAIKVAVGIANCVSMTSVEIAEGVDIELLQDVNVTVSSNESIDLPMIFNLLILHIILQGNAQRFALPARVGWVLA